MSLSREMVSDAIEISRLIIKEKLSRGQRPTKADTDRYNRLVRPRILAYQAKHGSTPRMVLQQLLKEYVASRNLGDGFEAKSVHYWGHRISQHVWATVTRKDEKETYKQNTISNYPQLLVVIDSRCIAFGLYYGHYVPADSEMVKIVRTDEDLQKDIVEVLKEDPALAFYDQRAGDDAESSRTKVHVAAVADVAERWSSNAQLIKRYEQSSIPADIESQIATTFDSLLGIFVRLSEPHGTVAGERVRAEKHMRESYWFVGADWGEFGDQSKRFIEEGTWENGSEDRYLDEVGSVQPGDLIAIKSSYTRKHKVPFDNKGNVVAVMAIKAIGTVTENLKDGHRLKVEWTEITPPREWYFLTNLRTIWRVKPDDWMNQALIDFTFNGKTQEYNRFCNAEPWRERFRTASGPETEDDTQEPSAYTIDDIISDGCFMERAELEAILSRLRAKKNLILQGPPGTGKTWLAKRLAFALVGQRDESKVRAVQFHPNLSYEDFVRGLRPGVDGRFELVDGPFLEMISASSADPASPYVIVIEEINRGNPAQILGEMLTLLEADRRTLDEALELCHRKHPGERVFIPRNLYVIGTMNIADRSLAMVDFALRRRFAFVNLEPRIGKKWRDWVLMRYGVEPDMLTRIEKRILALNDEIAADPNLGKQFCIGHSFVTPTIGATIGDTARWFREVVDTEIGRLLEEYWFDSPAKARNAKQRLVEGL